MSRLTHGLKFTPFGLCVPTIVQYATLNAVKPAVEAAFHPVSAMPIFCVGAVAVRQAWCVVARQ